MILGQKFCEQEKVTKLSPKKLCPKNFGKKNVGSEKFCDFDSEKFWVPKVLCLKKFQVPKSFGYQKMFSLKTF